MLCDISPVTVSWEENMFIDLSYLVYILLQWWFFICFTGKGNQWLCPWKSWTVEFGGKSLKIVSLCLIGESVLLWMTSWHHYSVVLMSVMASQITGVSIVYSILSPGTHQRKHQSSTHWPLWREFASEFPAQRTSNTENVFIWSISYVSDTVVHW